MSGEKNNTDNMSDVIVGLAVAQKIITLLDDMSDYQRARILETVKVWFNLK